MLSEIQPQPMPAAHSFKSINYTGLEAGPRLIITGAVHGNETCGTKAILRVIEDIERQRLAIIAGSVTFVPITNPLAYARGERVGDRNLNRNLYPVKAPHDFEDHIANWLCPLLAQHEVLLDLHSTRAQNPPFAMLGPENNAGHLQPFVHCEQERALAKVLGVNRFVDGWLATYARGVGRRVAYAKSTGKQLNPLNTDPHYGVGTTEYMRSVGGYSITLECGSHDDPQSPNVAYRAIRNTLAHLGLVNTPTRAGGSIETRAPVAEFSTPTPAQTPERVEAEFESLHMYEVHDKNHPDDRFARTWASFDPLKKGDVIGTRHDGTNVVADADGCILFPDAKAEPGNEWFYVAQTMAPI